MAEKFNALEAAQKIDKLLEGVKILSYTNCTTRLRITLADTSNVKKDELKAVSGVVGVVIAQNELQIVFSPSRIKDVALNYGKIQQAKAPSSNDSQFNSQATVEDLASLSEKNKAQLRKSYGGIQNFFTKFSKVFAPLIPAFIGAGILAGIAGIILSAYGNRIPDWVQVPATERNKLNWVVINFYPTAWNFIGVFNILIDIWKVVFLLFVGWKITELWGGTGSLGAIIAGLYISYSAGVWGNVITYDKVNHSATFLGIPVATPHKNWLTSGFFTYDSTVYTFGAPKGSIFGVMASSFIVIYVEKGFRKFIPKILDISVIPFLALIVMLVINLFLLIPISGYAFMGISWLFTNVSNNPFGTGILAMLFLLVVMLGIHQGFIPVYITLVTETGVNVLFPVLSQAGGALVGVSIAAMVLASKDSPIRKQISGSIVPGFLGIGEPLIYGFALPKVIPFIAASIAAGSGGFLMGALNMWGGIEAGINSVFGPSGLLATPIMTTPQGEVTKAILVYLGSLTLSYICGFATMYVMHMSTKKVPFMKKFAQKINYSLDQ